MSSNGVLYIAIGAEYLREARVSTESVRECMPDVSIGLITDQDVTDEPFDRIISDHELPDDYGASTLWPDVSPFERTIFLDTDTYVHSDISELFTVLDECDIAVATAPNQNTVRSVPDAFVELNTGVISFGSSEAVNEFFADWQRYYARWKRRRDLSRNQPSFAKALYESDLSVCSLPARYNCKSHFSGYLTGEVKLVHGRRHAASLETVAEGLDATRDKRIHRPNTYLSNRSPVTVYRNLSVRYRIEKSVADYAALASRGMGILRNEGVRPLYESMRNYLS